MKRVGKLIGASVTIQKCTSLNGNSVKVRDRPNRMTRNLEKQIIELSKLMRSDTRINSPTDGSTDDKRHDVIKRRVSVYGYRGCCTKGTPRAKAITTGVMTYSSPFIQLLTF